MTDSNAPKMSEEEQIQRNSRTMYAIGEDAMRKLQSVYVLVSGMGSVGMEVAKNLILAGLKRITIHDEKQAQWRDLSAQCYLTEDDVVGGKNRAEATLPRLSKLHPDPMSNLQVFTGPLTEDYIKGFDLVIITDQPLLYQLKLNHWTQKHDIKFISADSRGLFSYAFIDFGDSFTVADMDGEPLKEVLIEFTDDNGVAHTVQDEEHELNDGDKVQIIELNGQPVKGGRSSFKIDVVNRQRFRIPVAEAEKLRDGGRVIQVKEPSEMHFKPLYRAILAPDLHIWDDAKIGWATQLHHLWQALHLFENLEHQPPTPKKESHVRRMASNLMKEVAQDIDKALLRSFTSGASGNVQPVVSVIGGIVAQEAMKGITHRLAPICQFLYTHHAEAIPQEVDSSEDKANFQHKANRYTGQAAVFGWDFQKALKKQKWFIVGAGAIGCELLKNMAMMGLGCGSTGSITITDMDQIEISNLSRQFLFHREDVKRYKSTVAAEAAKRFNPQLRNIKALTVEIGYETEDTFSDEFFENLDGVALALDNFSARLYVDARCVSSEKLLIDSGTLGTKGSVQVVYPHLTESYASSNDPPTKGIPMCTLKQFPSRVEHVIEWSRNQFQKFFTVFPTAFNEFQSDRSAFLDALVGTNDKSASACLIWKNASRLPTSKEECVFWAMDLFDRLFATKIEKLVTHFPADHVDEKGVRFWGGAKRFPTAIPYSSDTEVHVKFVAVAATLLSHMCQLGCSEITQDEVRVMSEVGRPARRPWPRIDDKDPSALRKLLHDLPKHAPLKPIDYEKDDKLHSQLIHAISAVRAGNYRIEAVDEQKTRQIAGQIIPAISTTTAVAAGLACIEIYKTMSDVKLDSMRNAFVNLALPLFSFSEPMKPPVLKCAKIPSFTLWSKIRIPKPGEEMPETIGSLLDIIEEECGEKVCSMTSGNRFLYMGGTQEREKGLAESLRGVMRRGKNRVSICAVPDDDDGDDIPTVHVLSTTMKEEENK